ncbi:helix-turn-helix domain-containing protein [Patescibacteria group bacterium]|nr:helix-turn-helix domain-containing protein [Patescibacteria group bacterium]
MKSKDFYTTTELAKILKISRIAVFNKIKREEIKAQKMGRNFVIFKKDLENIDVNLFKLAQDWVSSKKEFPEEFYCQNSSIFQARVSKMEILITQKKKNKKLSPLLTSITGEIGNNSFDHNLGQWLDIPGIFFGYDLDRRQIVLADRGVGILKTLKRVKPELKNHKEALLTAFTEVISGRKPEARGNGLKYVRKIISKYPINLIFQTGNAKLTLRGGNQDINIENTTNNIKGCIALITY